jgi:hypothetical protein
VSDDTAGSEWGAGGDTSDGGGGGGGGESSSNEYSYEHSSEHADYGDYYSSYGAASRPPVGEPTRSDGTALFFAAFGRNGLQDFRFAYFDTKRGVSVRPARESDWAGLMMLANWPAPRKLIHWTAPHRRTDALDYEIADLLARAATKTAPDGRTVTAAVLETDDGAPVGLATLCRTGPGADTPPVAEVVLSEDFTDKADQLLAGLGQLSPLAGAVAYAEPGSPLTEAWSRAGFRDAGTAEGTLGELVPGLRILRS